MEELESEVDRLKVRILQLELEASHSRTGSTPIARMDGSEGVTFASRLDSETVEQEPSTSATNIGSTSLDALSEDKFVGESSGAFFGNILQTVLLHANYEHQQGHRRLKMRLDRNQVGSSASSELPETHLSIPDLEEAEKLQDAFFTHQWASLPFLHKPSFLKNHYEPVMADPQSASPISLFLTFMVFAMGAVDLSRMNQSAGRMHLEYFNVSITRYLDGLIRADNTQTVQGLLLVGYFAINECHSVNAWHVAGQAVRVAVDLGLHRASALGSYSLLDTEMRKRIFWTAYCLDRTVSVNLGRPPAIREVDITVELPLRLTDDELLSPLSPSFSSLPQVARHDDTSTLLYVIQVRKLQSKIQDLFYPANTSLSSIDVDYQRTVIRAELDDWIAKAPRFLHPTAVTYQSTEWFQIAYSQSLLFLYRPSPASPTVDLSALQICADAAISLIGSYSSLYAKNKISYTWLALHGVFMASVTMLYTIWVSPQIRRSTNKAVVKANVTSCLALFEVLRNFWPLASRCHEVIDRLGRASIALFDKPEDEPSAARDKTNQQHFGEINAEYMDWFGTREPTDTQSGRSKYSSTTINPHDGATAQGPGTTEDYMTTDVSGNMDLFPDLDQLFQQGFDMNIPLMTDAFDQPFISENYPR